jgi:hypothetical protein
LGHRVRGLQIRSTRARFCLYPLLDVGGFGLSHKRVVGAIASTGWGVLRR